MPAEIAMRLHPSPNGRSRSIARVPRRSMLRLAGVPLVASGALVQPAAAQTAAPDERPYCAARPGLGTTPCTIAPHRVSLEVAVADWERDAHAGMHADTVLLGGVAARIGLTGNSELAFEWTPFGETWVVGGGVPTVRGLGTGDLTISTKVNLSHPDGSAFSIAVAPFVGLPIGGTALGSGRWATGLTVPISVALGGPFSMQATPQLTLEAADQSGRAHVSGRMIGGLGVTLTDRLSVAAEASVGRQTDDGRTFNDCFVALSLAYLVTKNVQVDAGTAVGMNTNSPDMRFYAGIAKQF